MSMSAQENSMTARFARWLLGWAVRHWPEENRAWGLALAAEIDETASAFETVRWSFGGIMLFSRSVFSSAWKWLKQPTGSSLSGGSSIGGPWILPRRSRLFTVALLATAAVLLLKPGGREAVRTVLASWRHFDVGASDRRMLTKMAARAEKEKDAPTLAFVALSWSDEDRDPEESARRFEQLADQAVALDPHYVWIYGARANWPVYVTLRKEQLERLRAADPGNAVPYFLMARALARPKIDAIYQHRSPTTRELAADMERDPTWMELMAQAFAAPRYDSYYRRHAELAGTVWNRQRDMSPAVVLSGLASHAIPNLMNMRLYAETRFQEAQKAFAAGDVQKAEAIAGEVDSFGQRMADGSETRIEKLIGYALSRSAAHDLQDLYKGAGRAADAHKAAGRELDVDKKVQAMMPWHNPEMRAREMEFRRDGNLVQGFGGLAVLAAGFALIGLLILEFWPARLNAKTSNWRKALCWSADYAPGIFLVAVAGFLVSFTPYARALSEFRSTNVGAYDDDRMMQLWWSLFLVRDFIFSSDGGIWIWSFVIALLTALAILIVARSFYRSRRLQPTQS
jgi:hypothetical protein